MSTPGVEALNVPLRAVTRGPLHHLFGYYEKTPWSADGRHLLALETPFAGRNPEPGEHATVGLIDLADDDRFIGLDRVTQWSWQQGNMLQWLGSDPNRKIIYNRTSDSDGRPVACIRDIESGDVRTLDDSIYAVTPDGATAVTLDFHRLQWLRPGYGYVSAAGAKPQHPVPADSGIVRVDITSGKSELLLSIRDVAEFEPVPERRDCPHWVNHLQFNTAGTWLSFLHRWQPDDPALQNRGLRTRLMAFQLDDPSTLRTLCDARYFSHYDWRDDTSILGWANAPLGPSGEDSQGHEKHFYLFHLDGTRSDPIAPDAMPIDGHCSYSPASTPSGPRRWVLNDGYEDGRWYRTLYLWDTRTGERHDLVRVLAQPKEWPREARCDLHPRWNRDGTQVCIDSAHEGTRQMYVLDVSSITGKK